MIYYLDIPTDDQQRFTLAAHAKVEQVLARLGPVTREAIRVTEVAPSGVTLRQGAYRYSVAVTPDVNFTMTARDVIREAGIPFMTIGFRPDETYNRVTAAQVEQVAARLERVNIALGKGLPTVQ